MMCLLNRIWRSCITTCKPFWVREFEGYFVCGFPQTFLGGGEGSAGIGRIRSTPKHGRVYIAAIQCYIRARHPPLKTLLDRLRQDSAFGDVRSTATTTAPPPPPRPCVRYIFIYILFFTPVTTRVEHL